MQDWRDHAKKNNIDIIEHGKCQLCGAPLQFGISQCVDISSTITHKINHNDGIKFMTIFLCVDAHALQHSEIHGRWNIHFHLSRLNLILNDNIHWNYKLSPILSEVVDEYKKTHREERILPPQVEKRGAVTVIDVEKTLDDKEYIQLVNKWAKEVYDSFTNGHEISKEISALFKTKIGC